MNDTLSQSFHNPLDADIIVVGAGLSGLAAATYATRGGRSVTLFEKASEPGGRAITRQRDGFCLNLGAHALYHQTEAGEVLRELGVPYRGKEPPPLFALADDTLHRLPQSPLALVCTTLFDASAKLELLSVLASAMRADLLALQQVSVSEWLRRHARHPQVRAFLLMLARVTTYTNAPELQSAALLVEMVRKVPNVLYLDGGWQTLVHGLRSVALQTGVRMVTGARVVAVEHAEESVTGVRLANGDFYPAQAVIVATDPTEASALVNGGVHPTLSRWAREALPSHVACLDVALRRLPEPRNLGAFGIDRPLYMVVHSASANLAPQGGALIHSIRYQEPGEQADAKAVEQELETLLDRLQPGWRRELVERQFLPHMHATNAIVQAHLGGLPGRPGPAVPGIRNLFVAGDWVGPAGQLTAAGLASARLAARLACEQTVRQGGVDKADYSYVGA
jgi:phytoene dehydrogenase-like protein